MLNSSLAARFSYPSLCGNRRRLPSACGPEQAGLGRTRHPPRANLADDLPPSAKKPIDPAKLHGGSGDHGRGNESARAGALAPSTSSGRPTHSLAYTLSHPEASEGWPKKAENWPLETGQVDFSPLTAELGQLAPSEQGETCEPFELVFQSRYAAGAGRNDLGPADGHHR